MTAINTDTIDTAATRALEEQRPGLEARIAEVRDNARAAANNRTKSELVTAIRGMKSGNAAGTKEELVENYANLAAKDCAAGQELNNLEYAVYLDREAARAVNTLITAADKHAAKLAEYATDPSAFRWIADQAVKTTVAQFASGHAINVARVVESGTDLRDAVRDFGEIALRTVTSFPRQMVSNHGVNATALHEAAGASEFLATVAAIYGKSMQFSAQNVR